jgi:hypothetical protein
MTIVYEKDLINNKVSLGQTVKGSLKSITNTTDSYLLPLSKQTLVNVKFSVEQTVTEFDYYYLNTPVGYFSVYPGYKGIPNEGITFLMDRNDNYNSGYYHFTVYGSSQGVFRDGYTLEITEAPLPTFGRYVTGSGNEENLSANNIIRGFTRSDSQDSLKVTTPILPKGVTGTLVTYLADAGNFGAPRNDIIKMGINISNEGGRAIGSHNIAAKEHKEISKLPSGDYFLKITGGDYNYNYNSNSAIESTPPREYTLYTSFFSVFTEKQTVAINSANNDHFHGWAKRLNTVMYNEEMKGFTVSSLLGQASDTSTFVVKNKASDEVDTLAYIERLKFADAAIALDTSGVGGQAFRVYQAAFNRTPDLGGLGYWISRMDGGASLKGVAQGFVDSAEFKALYGSNPTNELLVSKLYDNVLHRAPDLGGYNYWLGILNSGKGKAADVLAAFSESPENQAGVIGVISNGILYTPFA